MQMLFESCTDSDEGLPVTLAIRNRHFGVIKMFLEHTGFHGPSVRQIFCVSDLVDNRWIRQRSHRSGNNDAVYSKVCFLLFEVKALK